MPDMQLSQPQIRRFETFGFLAFPGLLAERSGEIINAFENVFADRGGGHHGKQHDSKSRSCIVPFVDQSAVLSGLLDDPRIHGILTSLLGADFNYVGSDGNYYVGDTAWHSDGWNAHGIRFVKIAMYLDRLTYETGALRVIPGTHKTGDVFAETVQRDIQQSPSAWELQAADVPCVALDNRPGDVVVFDHNIKHASFGGGVARRMFTLNCCRRLPSENVGILRNYIGVHSRFWLDSMYGPAMTGTATPGRRVHLEQVLANESHLPELSAKHRRENAEPARG